MSYIKVWCEYDFNGNFGGNNNEEVFEVDESLTEEQVGDLVLDYLVSRTGCSEEEIKGLYDWEWIAMKTLGE